MTDLTNPNWIKLKGLLFLLVGGLASTLLLLEEPRLRVAGLLALAIWCFCRAYYFAFYVIQHYVDPGYRFSGLWSFARYLCARRSPRGLSDAPHSKTTVAAKTSASPESSHAPPVVPSPPG